MDDKIYSFIMRGELTKVALDYSGTVSKHHYSEIIQKQISDSLSLDLLDDEFVAKAKQMATVYAAIAAFENMVRDFVVKILIENKGENWWEDGVSQTIRKKAESRKLEEDKIKWHTQRGDSLINYTEFGDLASIMLQNISLFEDHVISIEWAKQIFNTLERSRNVIMHSGELGARDIERIGTNIRDWISQVGA
ncbi:Swt1 family HEPN domain-containing protein [Dehalobacter sp. DCM]|uniref:Swt1 family HEPN domain-containing protein n=1 Tax=Dehalobacter sp. DCM TaxID=2907827 RepID=UPI003082192D|nr:Swt1 family HEPN domain-containing protein [Dehalobacter sp. DCM]